ncbi:uncharacterized protein LOC133929877 [Phragmites australis]|uniref:uncharacterized protein LOC133929877 n=1 Tax=Phragmites australis TaxID=29695 RepID=UPI002D7A25C0|nr:uncharacterized protein LOC133929877 [Phragmites australis]
MNAEIFQNEKSDKARSMSSDQAPMESSDGPRPHGDALAVSAKKLWRVMRAVYLVLVKKHQPKLAALGVHLHHLLSSMRDHRGLAAAREQHPALTYLSSLSCRSMDPAAAVVHSYPRGHGHRRGSSGPAAASLSSLSCRSMDPAAAVCQYQYRPREVQFSCKSTPLNKRRRAQRRALGLQHDAADQGRDQPSEPEYYGSAAAVTRLFELMDVKEAAEETDVDYDDVDLDLESAVAWPALAVGPAPRQVRITDSPFLAREEIDEEGKGVVDRRADEFIMWFHEQLRTQQQRSTAHYLVR